jgi:hypothetical protein
VKAGGAKPPAYSSNATVAGLPDRPCDLALNPTEAFQHHGFRLGAVALAAAACLAAPAHAFQRQDTPDVLRAAFAAAPTTDRLIVKYRTASAASLRNGDASVEYAEPDRVLHALFVPADPMYKKQWSLSDAAVCIRAPAACDESSGTGIVVAAIDTGVRPHADLAANLRPSDNFVADPFVSNDNTARDAEASDPGDAVSAGYCRAGAEQFVARHARRGHRRCRRRQRHRRGRRRLWRQGPASA